MQRLFITYLATLILFQGIFFNSNILFEIDELMEDFQLHKVKYGDNLTTFLSKHFGNLKDFHKEQHQEEHKEHQHPQSDFNFSFQTDFVTQNSTIDLTNCIVKEKRNTPFFYKSLFSNFEKPTIFQPPRLA